MTTAPSYDPVRGYITAVLADLDDSLASVPRVRDLMGPGWDPMPTYRFHLALAESRLKAVNPPDPGGGVAHDPTPPPATPEGNTP